MNEGELARKLVKHIRSRDGYAHKTHGGRYSSGQPDITGCYRGWFIGMEVKLPHTRGRVTQLQAKNLEQIQEAGGFGVVVTSIAEVDAVLNEIDALEDE